MCMCVCVCVCVRVQVIPMLPRLLCEQLCSLNPNEVCLCTLCTQSSIAYGYSASAAPRVCYIVVLCTFTIIIIMPVCTVYLCAAVLIPT